jgi:hypothetical protein
MGYFFDRLVERTGGRGVEDVEGESTKAKASSTDIISSVTSSMVRGARVPFLLETKEGGGAGPKDGVGGGLVTLVDVVGVGVGAGVETVVEVEADANRWTSTLKIRIISSKGSDKKRSMAG